jgi:hypothetical protein
MEVEAVAVVPPLSLVTTGRKTRRIGQMELLKSHGSKLFSFILFCLTVPLRDKVRNISDLFDSFSTRKLNPSTPSRAILGNGQGSGGGNSGVYQLDGDGVLGNGQGMSFLGVVSCLQLLCDVGSILTQRLGLFTFCFSSTAFERWRRRRGSRAGQSRSQRNSERFRHCE